MMIFFYPGWYLKSIQGVKCLSSIKTKHSDTVFCFYYIHTEKYSTKSYVVNFRAQISSSQSVSRTMFFSRVRKTIRPIRSHRGVRVLRQNSRVLLRLAAPLRTHSTRKVLLNEFFSLKKWKTFRKWSGIVSFVSLSIKKMVESRRNNRGKG